MKKTVYLSQFRDEFRSIRPENFSYQGLEILFNYIEQFESDCAQEVELDVIALCCEYSEEPWQEIVDSYDIDLSECQDDDEKLEAVESYLQDNTQYCGTTSDGSIVYLVF